MTEPLIVVEGTLRLPSLRPLADPLLRFGREWLPLHTRPPQSLSEVPFFAARLRTTYVKAISLADRDSPYRPVNIWGVFADGPTRQFMLRLLQGLPPEEADAPSAPSAPPTPSEHVAQRIPLSFQPPSSAYRPQRAPIVTPLKAAIALACAALLAWMLFGMHPNPNRHDAATPVASPAQSATVRPATSTIVKQAAAVRPASVAKVQIAAPAAPVSTAAIASKVEAAAAVPSVPPARAIDRRTVAVSEPPAPVRATTAKPAHRPAKTASKRVAHNATQTQAKASAPVMKPSVLPTRAAAHRKTAVRAEASAYDAADEVRPPRAARPARDTQAPVRPPVPSSGERVIAPAATRPYTAMDTRSLYDMLLHSPTLDSNVGAGAANR
jgi:hypothetical protein